MFKSDHVVSNLSKILGAAIHDCSCLYGQQLTYSTGGLPGFEIEIRHNGEPLCQVISDYVCSSTEQKQMRRMGLDHILDEHFLLLPPGGLIGINVPLRTSCPLFPYAPALAPGRYQVDYTGYLPVSGMSLESVGPATSVVPALLFETATPRYY